MIPLSETVWFPDPTVATPQGFLAFGGDLSVERLLLAYNSGIFPWYSDGDPIMWWSPDPRMVLFPEKFKVSKSLRQTIKKKKCKVTMNQSFPEVIKNCAEVKRKDGYGTWITPEIQAAYIKLHHLGYAMSMEVWERGNLVGGLYGIDLPERKIFCGESMFSLVSDASKIAFYYLSQFVIKRGYKLIDCQLYNEHLASLGAEEIDREEFLELLNS